MIVPAANLTRAIHFVYEHTGNPREHASCVWLGEAIHGVLDRDDDPFGFDGHPWPETTEGERLELYQGCLDQGLSEAESRETVWPA